jgi:hypothetical protein
MTYTVRFAHLQKKPHLAIGDRILRGDYLATCGNTGASMGRHLHIDCVEGLRPSVWTLANSEHGVVKSSPRQLNYFIDKELFGGNDFVVTTPYGDYAYQNELKKVHLAYDLIPVDGISWELYWNRSAQGTVIYNEHHVNYGNCLMISFEA